MTLTAIVGGLVAFVARPKAPMLDSRKATDIGDKSDRWDRLEKVVQRVDELTRSQARLIDHIERLERELALQAELEAHWRGEAGRLARSNREAREREALRDVYQQAAQRLQPQANAALYQQWAQQAQAQNGQQLVQQGSSYQGYCNCVPSRSQVWAENVARLNAEDAIAQRRGPHD